MEKLDILWARGCEFLGSKYAIMGGAMTWVSEPPLVSALSNAGAFGVLATGAMPPSMLPNIIEETRQKTDKPFGVNLILLHPEIEEMISACCTSKVTHVVLAGGLPRQHHINQLKARGIKVIAFVPGLPIGRKLVKMGVDALVIEGMEAGGHIGPVSTLVLAQEIIPEIKEVPIFVAGGIGRGEAIAQFLQLGAAGCQLGTRFVCAEETNAHPDFKKAFLKGNARDAITSVQIDPRFPIIPVRALKNKGMESFISFQKDVIQRVDSGDVSLKEGQLEIEHFWAGALRRAVKEGDIEEGSLMAGQSVGLVKEIEPTSVIVERLVKEATSFLEGMNS